MSEQAIIRGITRPQINTQAIRVNIHIIILQYIINCIEKSLISKIIILIGVAPNIREWFTAIDQSGNGRVSALELQAALTNSDWSRFSMETCTLMIS